MGSAVLLGLLLDGVLGTSGLLTYAAAGDAPMLAPPWILALWAGFALTLTHSMVALATRPWAAAIFGLIGGPIAYASAGGVAGAVTFGYGMLPGLLAIAGAWAVAVPLLYWLDKTMTRIEPEAVA